MTVAFGHIAVVMMVCRRGSLTWLIRPFAAVGRMALTNYVMHTVICMTLFGGFGLGWFGQLARHQLYYIVAAIWTLQLVVSPLWLRRFRFGPLEWLWRSLTFARRLPLRVANPAASRTARPTRDSGSGSGSGLEPGLEARTRATRDSKRARTRLRIDT